MLTGVGAVVAIVCSDLLEPCSIEVSAYGRVQSKSKIQVVIGIKHDRAKSDCIVETLEDRPPGVKCGVGVASAAGFVLAVVHRGDDLARHNDPGCQDTVCG